MKHTSGRSLTFLPAATASAGEGSGPFVAIVRTREELRDWLAEPSPQLQWLQVEGLLDDEECWEVAAQSAGGVPIDVVMQSPDADFPRLYQLVGARAVREVRVTIPAKPGLEKAVRLAAALGFPVRILPGQPSAEELGALECVLEFYLRDPMVEAPVDPFHSLLTAMGGGPSKTLWMTLEHDPPSFPHSDPGGSSIPPLPEPGHLSSLVSQGAECIHCPWYGICAGYFKRPEPAYGCAGIKRLFARTQSAANELHEDLVLLQRSSVPAAATEGGFR